MFTPVRIPFETYMRQAAVDLLTDYAQDANISTQIYRARPASLFPPTGYIERLRETISWQTQLRGRTVLVDIRMIWGLFDSGEAVDQRDLFLDGLIDWVSDHRGQGGASVDIAPVGVEDDPEFLAEWLKEGKQGPFFASILTLEGFAGGY